MESVKLLLIGAGFMGQEHIKASRGLESVVYVGVADTNIKAAQNLGSEHCLNSFSNIEHALEKTKPDAVDICVPTPYHLSIVKKSAEYGVHVLCEKPISRLIDDALEIKKIADKKNVRIMAAQVMRFWPEYVHAREIALSEKYGTIL